MAAIICYLLLHINTDVLSSFVIPHPTSQEIQDNSITLSEISKGGFTYSSKHCNTSIVTETKPRIMCIQTGKNHKFVEGETETKENLQSNIVEKVWTTQQGHKPMPCYKIEYT